MGLITKGLGRLAVVVAAALLLYLGFVMVNLAVSAVTGSRGNPDAANRKNADRLFEQGKRVFRFDTFGDEAFWGGALQLHRAIEGEKLGGVGPGVSPRTALAVGLKVDSRGPPAVAETGSRRGAASTSTIPATTLALLKLNAVVGVKGFFNGRGTLSSIGITVRLLPLDGRRLVRARHRTAARRLAEPRPQRRRDRLAGPEPAAAHRPARRRRGDREPGSRRLGAGQVRRRALPRRQGLPPRREDGGRP